jgi:PilZ domain
MEATKTATLVRKTTPADAHPSPRVLEFVRTAIREEKVYKGGERRAHLRYPVSMSVRATPLDDHKKPIAEPFDAVTHDISVAGSFAALTRDISAGGISMHCSQPVKEKFLQLELTAPKGVQLNVTLEVLRCLKKGPFYEVGGRFVGEG